MKITDVMKIFSSERRIEVLDALFTGEPIDSVKEHIPPSTYSFTINYLKNVGYVEEVWGSAVLTDRGRGYLIIFEQFKENLDLLLRLHDHFPDHVIHFPDRFYTRLHELQGFQVITSEPSNVLKPHQVFFDHIRRSKYVLGISPLLFPDYVDFFGQMVEQSRSISLVVTPEVYEEIASSDALHRENVQIYIIDTAPPIAAAVTDQFVSIGFFYRSGSYDFTRDLIATSPEAKKFGHDLIEHYIRKSRKMTMP